MSNLRRLLEKYKVTSTLTLVVLAFIWLLPTIGLLITSVREKTEAQTSGWWVIFTKFSEQKWTGIAYHDVITNGNIGTSFISSLAVTIPATVLPLLFAAYAAFGFTFLRFRGREIYFSIIQRKVLIPNDFSSLEMDIPGI